MDFSQFHLCPNCFPGFEQDTLWKYASETPIRNISLSAGADPWYSRPIIPEFMVDVSFGGEWKKSIPDLKNELQKYGLNAVCIGSAGNIGYSGSERLVRNRVDFAARMGVPLLNIACPPYLTDSTAAYGILRELGMYAQDNGIQLVVETHGGITSGAEECLKLMDAVGDTGIMINYDTGNVLRFNPDLRNPEKLADDLKRLTGCIGCMHLKDYDAEKETVEPLGDGLIDFSLIFEILENMSFSGQIGLDLETTEAVRIGTAEAHNKAMKRSINHIHKLIMKGHL